MALKGLGLGVVLIIFAAAVFGGMYILFLKPSPVIGPSSTSTTPPGACPSGYYLQQGVAPFVFTNAYSGAGLASTIPGGISGGNVSLLDPNAAFIVHEDSSSGTIVGSTWTTGKQYTTGQTWHMKISSGNTKAQFDVSIACGTDTRGVTIPSTNVYVVVYPGVSALAISITSPNGTQIANGNSINVTKATPVATKPIMSVTVVNTVDNTGWSGSSGVTNPASVTTATGFDDKSANDPQLGRYQHLDLAMVIKISVASASPLSTILNYPQLFSSGVNKWFGQPFANEMSLDRYKLSGGNYDPARGGSYATSVQLDSSGMAGGAGIGGGSATGESITIYVYYYFDTGYLAKYGAINSQAVNAASISFVMLK